MEEIRKINCMSSEPHEVATDNLSHYLGCVRLGKREGFYKGLTEEAQDGIKTELRRISYLRDILRKSKFDEDKQFVGNVDESLKTWREEHQQDIAAIAKKPNRGNTKAHDPNKKKDTIYTEEGGNTYDPDKDLKAYAVNFCDGKGVTDETKHPDKPEKRLYHGEFPHQKIPVYDLLQKDSPLKKSHKFPKGGSRVRYFHLPSNNMKWVEKAIKTYYDESNTEFDTPQRKAYTRTEANTLLHRNLWLRQEHGRDSTILHARHMQTLCEIVSSDLDTKDIKSQKKNVVMFMPYLHWDSDRQRKIFTSYIERRAAEHHDRLEEDENKSFKRRQRDNHHIHNLDDKITDNATENGSSLKDTSQPAKPNSFNSTSYRDTYNYPESRKNSIPAAAMKLIPSEKLATLSNKKRQLSLRSFSRLEINDSLGRLLFDAAKLFEVMDNFRDRRLLDQYLLENPPMHPRRTLDQAHYCSLRSTRARDRDQVVYRQTSVKPDLIHHYYPHEKESERWDCAQRVLKTPSNPRQSSKMEVDEPLTDTTHDQKLYSRVFGRKAWARKPPDQSTEIIEMSKKNPERTTSALSRVFSGLRDLECGVQNRENRDNDNLPENHCKKCEPGRPMGCPDCRDAIRKNPRLIMVDQLWMWILDGETILTCFPRRYGVNRKDSSGVFRSIRMRLGNTNTGRIQTAYDVALCIIDECCNVFFDRTKTDDRKPPVIDIFSESISNMAHKQVIYSAHLWHWAEELAKASTKKSSSVDVSSLHIALLNITPEGKLQRETKDIIEELHIMIGISRKQREVLKRFRKHGETLLDSEGYFRKGRYEESMFSRQGRLLESQPTVENDGFYTEETFQDLGIQFQKWKSFTAHADELMDEADDRLDELETLHRNAEDVCKDIDHLLSMKQQQASVLQAWQAIRHGEEAVKQGRAIMIFTVITIIFLPLAFMAAIFGMNNTSTADDKMPLTYQLKLIFSISIVVIAVVVVIAFSSFIRSLFWCVTYFCINWFFVKSGLYGVWLSLPDITRPRSLISWSETQVDSMRQSVRKRIRQEAAKKIEQRRKTQAEEDKEKEKNQDQDEYQENCDGQDRNQASAGEQQNGGPHASAGSPRNGTRALNSSPR